MTARVRGSDCSGNDTPDECCLCGDPDSDADEDHDDPITFLSVIGSQSLSAALVRVIRRTRGLNNREIAEERGLSESFLSRVANGKLNLTLKHLADIERKLNTPLRRQRAFR